MKQNSNSVTIRMGAAHWDVTLHGAAGDTVFDLRGMAPKERGKFHGVFMSSVRKMMRGGR